MRTVMTGVLLSVCVLAANKEQSENTRRLEQAADVFSEIMATPDKAIPRNLLESAYCLVVVPSMKQGAFIVGAKYGVGYISCRETGRGRWSAPGTVRIEGGSFGFQIGGSETDLVMLVKNKRGADRLLSDEFTLGGQGELSAGPVGRSATAQTDAQLSAEILSWSRSHGLFGGVARTGATLRQDIDDNEAMYGKRLTNRQIVEGRVPPPSAARRLIALFNKYSWRVTS
jgi:SH3 domain-containing YSC84-like protein 1